MHIYADDQWSIPADSAYVELAGEMFSMLTDPTRDGTLTRYLEAVPNNGDSRWARYGLLPL